MNRQAVTSSNVASIGFEPSGGTLEVEFHSGDIYQYFAVPVHVCQSFLTAPSHGKFFHANIRDRYRFAKVTPARG
jgi:hypothetical protein